MRGHLRFHGSESVVWFWRYWWGEVRAYTPPLQSFNASIPTLPTSAQIWRVTKVWGVRIGRVRLASRQSRRRLWPGD